jgi:hypothetical protein
MDLSGQLHAPAALHPGTEFLGWPQSNAMEKRKIICQSVPHRKHINYVSATKPNRLMLFRETVAVYCKNHTEHTDTLWEQNEEF